MKITRVGRSVFPAASRTARMYARDHLLSIHRRRERFLAILGRPKLRGQKNEEIGVETPLALMKNPPVYDELPEAIVTRLKEVTEWLILLDYDGAERSRTMLFLFRDGTLDGVMKIREISSTGRALAHEARILKHLESRSVDQVPRVVDQVATTEHEILLLSPLPGRPLAISMQRSLWPVHAHAEHLRQAGKWLGRFHRKMSLGSESGVRTTVHGDLWARNLLFENRELSGVVDWEHASLEGDPWHDLFSLPLLFVIHPPSWGETRMIERFRRGFLEDSRESKVVRSYFDAYCAETAVTTSEVESLFDQYLEEGEKRRKEEIGWRATLPWREMREAFRNSQTGVFSG